VILPADMELFSISAGGVVEPRETGPKRRRRTSSPPLAPRASGWAARDPARRRAADEFADITTLHRAVADAISLHHSRAAHGAAHQA
jgi:hypothetical protein